MIEISLLLVVLSIIIVLGVLLQNREMFKKVLTSLVGAIMFVVAVIGVIVMLLFIGHVLDTYF